MRVCTLDTSHNKYCRVGAWNKKSSRKRRGGGCRVPSEACHSDCGYVCV